jgi:hypothetical protein
MMEIPLSQGKIAIVDDADYGWLSQWKWCAFRSEKELFYATRSESVGVGLNKQRHIRMHHAIIGKPSKGFVSDHINGNGLDNRRENLRHVTHRENCQNKHCSKSSRYPGVCWHKHEQKWMARIGVGGKSIFLGYFISEEDAAQKYKNMCVLVAEWAGGGRKCLILGLVVGDIPCTKMNTKSGTQRTIQEHGNFATSVKNQQDVAKMTHC